MRSSGVAEAKTLGVIKVLAIHLNSGSLGEPSRTQLGLLGVEHWGSMFRSVSNGMYDSPAYVIINAPLTIKCSLSGLALYILQGER